MNFNIKNIIQKIFPFFKKRILIDLIRPNNDDFNLLEILFKEGVKKGSYTQDLIKSNVFFKATITSLISNSGINTIKVMPFFDKKLTNTFICTYDKQKVGFITIAVNFQLKEIEIWYFSIKEEFQNKRLGKKCLDIFLSDLKNNKNFKGYYLFARCKPSSKQMINILVKNKFYKNGSNKGYDFYYNNTILK